VVRLTKPRIVLADNSQCMRQRVARVLSATCEVDVVGCALNGAQAVDTTLQLQPDILILAVIMPVLDGIAAARKLREADSPRM
jgi:chemotaxis response regulator CheB